MSSIEFSQKRSLAPCSSSTWKDPSPLQDQFHEPDSNSPLIEEKKLFDILHEKQFISSTGKVTSNLGIDTKLPSLGPNQHFKILELLTNPYTITNEDKTVLAVIHLGKFFLKLKEKHKNHILGIVICGSATDDYLGEFFFEAYNKEHLGLEKTQYQFNHKANSHKDIDIRFMFKEGSEELIKSVKREFINFLCESGANPDLIYQQGYTKLHLETNNGNFYSIIGIRGGHQPDVEMIFTCRLQTEFLMNAYDLYIPLDAYLMPSLINAPISTLVKDELDAMLATIPVVYPFGSVNGGHQAMIDRLLKIMNVPVITDPRGWIKLIHYNTVRGYQPVDHKLKRELVTTFLNYCNTTPPSAVLYDNIRFCAQEHVDPYLMVYYALCATSLLIHAINESEIKILWKLIATNPLIEIDHLPNELQTIISLLTDEDGVNPKAVFAIMELAALFSKNIDRVIPSTQNQWMLEFSSDDGIRYLLLEISPTNSWDTFCQAVESGKHIKPLAQLFSYFIDQQTSHTQPVLELLLESLNSEKQMIRMAAISLLAVIATKSLASKQIENEIKLKLPQLIKNCPSLTVKKNLLRKASHIFGPSYDSALKAMNRNLESKERNLIDYIWYSALTTIDSTNFFPFYDRIPILRRGDYIKQFLNTNKSEALFQILPRIMAHDPSQMKSCFDYLEEVSRQWVDPEKLSAHFFLNLGTFLLHLTVVNEQEIHLSTPHQRVIASLITMLLAKKDFKTAEEILIRSYNPSCDLLEKTDRLNLWVNLFSQMENQGESLSIWRRALESGCLSLECAEATLSPIIMSLKIQDDLDKGLLNAACSTFFSMLIEPVNAIHRPKVLHLFHLLWDSNVSLLSSQSDQVFLNLFKFISDNSLKTLFPQLMLKKTECLLQLASNHAATLKTQTIKSILMTLLNPNLLESYHQLTIENYIHTATVINHLLQYFWNPADHTITSLNNTLLNGIIHILKLQELDTELTLSLLKRIQLYTFTTLDRDQTHVCLICFNRILLASQIPVDTFEDAEGLFGKFLKQFDKSTHLSLILDIIVKMVSFNDKIDRLDHYMDFLSDHFLGSTKEQRVKIIDTFKSYLRQLETKGHYVPVLQRLKMWKNHLFAGDFLQEILTPNLLVNTASEVLPFLYSNRNSNAVKGVLTHTNAINLILDSFLRYQPPVDQNLEALIYFIPLQAHVDVELLLAFFTMIRKGNYSNLNSNLFNMLQKIYHKGFLNDYPTVSVFFWLELLSQPGVLNTQLCLTYLNNPTELFSVFSDTSHVDRLFNIFKVIYERLFTDYYPKLSDPLSFLKLIDISYTMLEKNLSEKGWKGNLWEMDCLYFNCLIKTTKGKLFLFFISYFRTRFNESDPQSMPQAFILDILIKILSRLKDMQKSENGKQITEEICSLFDDAIPKIAGWSNVVNFAIQLINMRDNISRIIGFQLIKEIIRQHQDNPYFRENHFVPLMKQLINITPYNELKNIDFYLNELSSQTPYGDAINDVVASLIENYLCFSTFKNKSVVEEAFTHCFNFIKLRYPPYPYTPHTITAHIPDLVLNKLISYLNNFNNYEYFVDKVQTLALTIALNVRFEDKSPNYLYYKFIKDALDKISIIGAPDSQIKTYVFANFKLIETMLVKWTKEQSITWPLDNSEQELLASILESFIFNLHLAGKPDYSLYKLLADKLLTHTQEQLKDSPYLERFSNLFMFKNLLRNYQPSTQEPSSSTSDQFTISETPITELFQLFRSLSKIPTFFNCSTIFTLLYVLQPDISTHIFNPEFNFGEILNRVIQYFRKHDPKPHLKSVLARTSCELIYKLSLKYHLHKMGPGDYIFLHKNMLELYFIRLELVHHSESKIYLLEDIHAIIVRARDAGIYNDYFAQYLVDIKEVVRYSCINFNNDEDYIRFITIGCSLTMMAPIEFLKSTSLAEARCLTALLALFMISGSADDYNEERLRLFCRDFNTGSDDPKDLKLFIHDQELHLAYLECVNNKSFSFLRTLIDNRLNTIKVRTVGEINFVES